MTEEKMFEIPEWLARKLIELLTLELEQTREALHFKEMELDQAYGELFDLKNRGGDTECADTSTPDQWYRENFVDVLDRDGDEK